MPFNLILNNSNVLSNNTYFEYRFKGGGFRVNEGAEICVSQIVYPFSWFNVNEAIYANNVFSYTWNGVLNTVKITSGHYSVKDINRFLQLYMIEKGHYLVNASGKNVFYIEIKTNLTYYANEITVYPIPTSLPSGYTNPASFPFSSTSGITPIITIPDYNSYFGFGSLIGFLPGSYFTDGPSTVSKTLLSNCTANITPITSIVIRCNLCKNDCTSVADVLDTFSVGNTSFGTNITYSPPYEKWISMNHGYHHTLVLYLQDQNFNRIEANDSNIMISLLLKNPQIPLYVTPVATRVEESAVSESDTLKGQAVVPVFKPIKFKI